MLVPALVSHMARSMALPLWTGVMRKVPSLMLALPPPLSPPGSEGGVPTRAETQVFFERRVVSSGYTLDVFLGLARHFKAFEYVEEQAQAGARISTDLVKEVHRLLASGANASLPQFTTITTEDVGPFLTGRSAVPYRVSVAEAARVDFLEDFYDGMAGERAELLQAVRDQLTASSFRGDHLLERDMAAAFSGGIETNEAYSEARQQGMALSTSFPPTPLGAQLKTVAETISVRDRLFASRQIFFVGLGGFDTHSAQARNLPRLLSQIDGALAAFQASMEALGLGRDVTLFTASDFGRTLAVNGDGTDHGWGGHQIVLGGAVKGGEIYGSLPPPTLGHDADSGGGRLIPSIAVDTYAAQLGRWFGLNETELLAALPGLTNFDPLATNFI